MIVPSALLARPADLRMRAHQTQCELLAQKLVVSEARISRAFRLDRVGIGGMVDRFERVGKGRKILCGDKRRLEPFRYVLWQALQRRINGAGDRAELQSFRRAIDRLDGCKISHAFGIENAIGMHDLATAVVKFEPSGHETPRADGQALLDPADIGHEEDELHVAGIVLDMHAVGAFGVTPARRAVLGHTHVEHDLFSDLCIDDFRPRAAIDRVVRKVKQKIEDSRGAAGLGKQAIEQKRAFRSDPGEGGHRGKQRIEQGRAHVGGILPIGGALSWSRLCDVVAD